jgi:hypothetical protein
MRQQGLSQAIGPGLLLLWSCCKHSISDALLSTACVQPAAHGPHQQ